jgi:hypothetical protein
VMLMRAMIENFSKLLATLSSMGRVWQGNAGTSHPKKIAQNRSSR